MLRILTLFALGLATAAWLWAVVGLAMQGSVLGIGFVTIAVTTAIFLAFALPAFILALRGRLLWLAPLLAMLSLLGVAFVA